MLDDTEIAVIGGGIVGLAAAFQLTKRLDHPRIAIFEKEPELALHQTGRNSGVMHSGIYYRPGSFKATFCRDGKKRLEEFCQHENLPFELCGKLIVAVGPAERERLANLHQRGLQNGVRCELWGTQQMRAREPHVAGQEAIYVPESGIIDYRAVVNRLADAVRSAGGHVHVNTQIQSIAANGSEVKLRTSQGEVRARRVVNCAGLHSDRVSRMAGIRPQQMILPFRGEYYELRPEARSLCRHLIYPVPDSQLPFLGVHFTRMIGGRVECGPNAVPAMKREGYTWGDIDLRDMAEMLSFPGTWRMAGQWWKTGLGEIWRSLSKRAFVKALQRLIPDVQAADLVAAPAGVRAQAVNRQGALLDDFVLVPDGRILHVLNAPSPAATASLAIGDAIADAFLAQV